MEFLFLHIFVVLGLRLGAHATDAAAPVGAPPAVTVTVAATAPAAGSTATTTETPQTVVTFTAGTGETGTTAVATLPAVTSAGPIEQAATTASDDMCTVSWSTGSTPPQLWPCVVAYDRFGGWATITDLGPLSGFPTYDMASATP